jgi:DNA-binding transcriptional MocR family regulator
MRLRSPWKPRLADGSGLLFEKLATAVVQDLSAGRIPPGARLPAHRDLAFQLGLGIGTVSKAYSLLERRGIVESIHGRGMFVVAKPPAAAAIVDLSINVPPQLISDHMVASTLGSVSKRVAGREFGSYVEAEGNRSHRTIMAAWIANHRFRPNPERLILCNGAQHALSIAFGLLCKSGAVVLTEEFPYPGAALLARLAGFQLRGIPCDDGGLCPDALERFLLDHAGENRPFVLYITPTTQNPTGTTMDAERREAIAQICRRHDVAIVEDDVYSILAGRGRPAFAELAPDLTFYVTGLSKTLTPGLRIGVLIPPEAYVQPAIETLKATGATVSGLACFVMDQWMSDGTAGSISQAIRDGTAERTRLATEILGPHMKVHPVPAFHAWLAMDRARADIVFERAQDVGIILTQPSASLIDRGQSGVRLCLGAPTKEQLEATLYTLRGILDQPS